MKYTDIVERLKADGKDTCEIESMLDAYKDADFNDIEFYQNQLYGVLCGLAVLGYITPDQVNEIQNELEMGNF